MRKGLCASNDRKNALAMARSRYADFYRADFHLTLLYLFVFVENLISSPSAFQ